MLTVEIIKPVVDLLSNSAITLLTVLLPVYALGISLVGPSASRRKEETDKLIAEETEANRNAIEKAQKALGAADTNEAREQLGELEVKRKRLEERRKKIESSSQSLRLKYSLLHPSILLLLGAVALRISGVLLERSVSGREWCWVFLWVAGTGAIVGIALIGRALWRTGRTFLLIEDLGLRVSEFNRQELRSVLQEVLRERDEGRARKEAVKLRLSWKGPPPPFRLHPGEKLTIQYELTLEDKSVTNDTQVWFLVPPGFRFDGLPSWNQGADRADIANYVTAKVEHGKLRSGIASPSRIGIVGSSEPGDYKAFYQIISDEYVKRESFQVVIEKGA